ncbi:hypothetical protein ACQUW5_15300, partial [Legionella sp. CNM-1927-20]|uniref:hypothetical protein n=1 Tax=Legionella sp. CNM-1927-20 TaxID=3422221 RepID=UPI00403AC0D5
MFGDSSSEGELNKDVSTSTSKQTTSETPTSSKPEIDFNVFDSIPSELIDEQFISTVASALREDNQPSKPRLPVDNNNNNQPMSLTSGARKRKTPTAKTPNKVWVYEGTGDIYTGLPPS